MSLLATFLTEEGGVPPPVDLQNFVAFQDGFDKLFKAVGEASGELTSRACRAVFLVLLTSSQCYVQSWLQWSLLDRIKDGPSVGLRGLRRSRCKGFASL